MELHITNEGDMKRFGALLGTAATMGDVLELAGDIGSGKTTLTKGIAAGMGIDEDVQSPSFTINRLYDGPDGRRLAHYDFYRLSDPGIMAAELAETAADGTAVTVVEWADIVANVLPADRLTIRFLTPADDSRQLELSAHGPKSRELIGKLA